MRIVILVASVTLADLEEVEVLVVGVIMVGLAMAKLIVKMMMKK
jgi:hypothetical protein